MKGRKHNEDHDPDEIEFAGKEEFDSIVEVVKEY